MANKNLFSCDICGEDCEEGNRVGVVIRSHFKNLPSALRVSTSIAIIYHDGDAREADICVNCVTAIVQPNRHA